MIIYGLRTFVAFLLAFIAFHQPCFAGHFGGNPPDITLDCNGFTITTAATLVADTDNTGNNSEIFEVLAYDGWGTVIYDYSSPPLQVGNSVPVNTGFTQWQSQPQFNPLTRQLISKAGNNHPASVMRTLTGTCTGLPTAVCPSGEVRMGTQSYNTIHEAIMASQDLDVIRANMFVFSENLVFAGNGTVTLRGGYACDFVLDPGVTTVEGSITIGGTETVTIENIILL